MVTGYHATLKTRDDKPFVAELNSKIVFSPDGEPQYIEGIFRDVTTRLEAEEKVRVSELFYRSLFENTGAATVLFDNDGLIERCNSKFEELAGLPREQIVGKLRWTDFVDKDELQRMWNYHQQRLRAGSTPPKDYDFTFLSHDGSKRFVHVTVDRVEELESRTASLVDITNRKQVEEELATLNARLETIVEERTQALATKAVELEKANARLMELDEIKSSLVSSVSHELRTPLTALLGFAKLINKNFLKYFSPLAASDPELRNRAEVMLSNFVVIDREGRRLVRLLNDLLDLSRIESGEIRWHDEPTAISQILQDAVDAAIGEFYENSDVELLVDAPEDSLIVNVDKDKLQQVLLNLLNNAAKYTRRGEVALTASRRGPWIEVRVKDTGVGIPENQLSEIFEIFHTHRRNDTLSGNPGTGLGLAICRQIVEHYGGTIEVFSTPGQGSEFVFTLLAMEDD